MPPLSTTTPVVAITLLRTLSLLTVPLRMTTTILATTTGDLRATTNPPPNMVTLRPSTKRMDRLTAETVIATKATRAATTPRPTITPMTMAILERVVIINSLLEGLQAVVTLMAAEEPLTQLPLTGAARVVATAAALLGALGVMVSTKVLLLTKADLLNTERLDTAVGMTTTLLLMAAELLVMVEDMVEAVDTKACGRSLSRVVGSAW
jgi:hypothetical protein